MRPIGSQAVSSMSSHWAMTWYSFPFCRNAWMIWHYTSICLAESVSKNPLWRWGHCHVTIAEEKHWASLNVAHQMFDHEDPVWDNFRDLVWPIYLGWSLLRLAQSRSNQDTNPLCQTWPQERFLSIFLLVARWICKWVSTFWWIHPKTSSALAQNASHRPETLENVSGRRS